jgi:hypothetical protein
MMTRAGLLAVAAAFSFALPPDPSSAATRALVVGVNAYPNITVGGVGGQRDLRGAVNDAHNIGAALVEYFGVLPEEILTLLDEDASRDRILAEFGTWLIDGTTAGDRVIFYFSGHGAQVVDENGDEGEDGFDEVLVPSDTRAELDGPDAGLSGFISDDEIDVLIGSLPGREIVLIIDSCHSGTITRGALSSRGGLSTADPEGQGIAADGAYTGIRTITPNGPLGVLPALDSLATRSAHRTHTRLIEVVGPEPAASTPEPTLLAAWSAVASAQLAVEDLGAGGAEGLFTNRFVEGIASMAADSDGNGHVSAAELLAYLRAEADTYCTTYECGPGGMTPALEAYPGYDAAVLYSQPAAPPPEHPGDAIASHDVLPDDIHPLEGALTVTLPNDGYAAIGTPLRLRIDSSVTGELIILDVRDHGTTVQLFPNGPSLAAGSASFIVEGAPRILPGDLDPFALIPDSTGTGRIVVLVVDPSVPLAALTGRYLDLAPIPSPAEYVAEISRMIHATVTQPVGSEEALTAPAVPAWFARAEAYYEIY